MRTEVGECVGGLGTQVVARAASSLVVLAQDLSMVSLTARRSWALALRTAQAAPGNGGLRKASECATIQVAQQDWPFL